MSEETTELPKEVKALRDRLAADFGVPEDQAGATVKRTVGLDIKEIKPDDAQKALEAWESQNFDDFGEVMLEYGVDEDTVENFLRMASEAVGSRSDPPDTGSSGEGGKIAKLEARLSQIEQNQPDVDEVSDAVVHKINQQMGGAAGGGGGGGAPADAGGQNNLAPIISAIMSSQGGSGVGQMMEEAAMKSFVRKLSRPSLGEMLEMSMMKDMSEKMGPQFADSLGDDWAEKYFSGAERDLIDDDGSSDDDS